MAFLASGLGLGFLYSCPGGIKEFRLQVCLKFPIVRVPWLTMFTESAHCGLTLHVDSYSSLSPQSDLEFEMIQTP